MGVGLVGLTEAATEMITGRWQWASHAAPYAAHASSATLLALGWLGLRLPRRLPVPVDAVDALLLIGATTLLGVRGALDPDPHHLILMVLSLVACLVSGRAMFVGGTLTSTALLSTVALVPVMVAYIVTLSHMPKMDVASLSMHTVRTTVAMLLVVLLALFGAILSGQLSAEQRRSRLLGQYQLGRPVGRGGMGIVHRAYHVLLRRPVAIKLLVEERRDPEDVQRFEREVQLTSRLNHPNTIAIYDYGVTPDGWPYYVMELVEGWNLDELVRESGPLPTDRVIGIMEQVCGSLAEAHDLGLIHRDIKPSNILVSHRGGDYDVVKVLDFGLVRALLTSKNKSRSDSEFIEGTPAYMAPEAVTGVEGVGPHTDLYSLGAVGYFLLTGTPVFTSSSVVEVLADHLHTSPEPPSQRLGRPVPADLERLLLSCLEKAPALRPANARSLRAELRECRTRVGWTEKDAERWWESHPAPAPTQERAIRTSTVAIALDTIRQRWAWSERHPDPPS